jgi:transcriptional regulator with XRE-family HTH domain
MQSSRVAGRRIQIHRVNLGESPEQFGGRIGVSGMTVRRIEGGKPLTVRTAFLIAADMQIAVTELWPPVGRRAVAA